MRFAQIAAPLAMAGLTLAAPLGIEKRQSVTDADILNYALTLEHLEATFYAEGLNMYNAGAFKSANLPDWVRYRLTEIASQEATHVNTLTAGLKAAGATPVAACTYDFGITSPESYIATAQLLEGVGVSAYLGAAPLIQNKAYLALAGAILVVEAEHDTWVRSAASNLDGFPRPFSPYLDLDQVYSLAALFIKSCPSSNPALPVKAFPSITVNTKGPYAPGQKISISASKANTSGTIYAAFVDAASTTYQQVDLSSGSASITIPSYALGQSYLILTNAKAMNDAVTVAGPAVLEVPVQATTFSYCTPGKTC